MAQRDKLFKLVTSLSKSEKRFVRLQASVHAGQGSKRYMELFDAVDAQSQYNEAQLCEQFGGDAENFATLKHYLYQAILKSLYLMKLEATPEARVVMMNAQADILEKKGLKDQSMALLRKSKKLALRNELPTLAVSSMLRTFSHLISKDLDHYSDQLDALLDEVEQNSSDYREYLRTIPLVKQMYVAMSTDFRPRNPTELQRYQDLLQQAQAWDPDNIRPVLARRNVLLCLATAHRMLGNKAETLRFYEDLYLLAREYRSIERYRLTVSAALFNMCIACVEAHQAERFDTFFALLLEEGDCLMREGDRHIKATAQLLKPYMLCEMGESEQAVKAIQTAEKNISEINWKIAAEYELFKYQLSAVAQFGCKNYHAAIESLNNLFAFPNARQISRQRYFSSRLMLLILHFELDNIDTLEALLPAIWSQMQARGQVYKLEVCLKQFFSAVIRRGTTQVPQGEWQKLDAEMQLLKQDIFERSVLAWFNIPIWVRSKLESRDFAELVREEFGRSI